MNFESLDNNARIWVYQADRAIRPEEVETIQQAINNFASEWNAHGRELTAAGTIIDDHFIVLGVKDGFDDVSGCSIDSSIRFVKEVGQKMDIDFLNRLRILTQDENGNLEYVSHGKLKEATDRMMYNTLISSKAELADNFKIKVSDYLASRA